MTITVESFNARDLNSATYRAHLLNSDAPESRTAEIIAHNVAGDYPRVVRAQPGGKTYVVHIQILSGTLADKQEEIAQWFPLGLTGDLIVTWPSETRRLSGTVQRVVTYDGGANRATLVLFVPDPRWKSETTQTFLGGGVQKSGGLVTDVTRAAGLEGDGLTSPAGAITPAIAYENLVTNGGFETNTTGWAASGTNAIARSTALSKFGAASLRVTYADNLTLATFAITGLSISTVYWFSKWVYLPSDYNGTQVRLNVSGLGSAVVDERQDANMATLGSWQRLWIRVTTDGADTAGNLILEDTGAPTVGRQLYLDGVQLTRTDYLTPYTETDGGTSSETAGRLRMRATGDLDETAGWFALRMQCLSDEIDATPYPAVAQYAFGWLDDASNKLQIVYTPAASNTWAMARQAAGAGASATSAAVTPMNGDLVTVIGRWSSALVAISVNGAAFVTASNTSIPTLAATLADIGAAGDGAGQLGHAVLWAAAGTGTLTDADAATLHALGAVTPTAADLPAAAVVTFSWDASMREANQHEVTVANDGTVNETAAVLTLTPRANKLTADGWIYAREIIVANRVKREAVNYALDITAGGFDHAALTTAKSLANGDDVRVLVDGVEVPRWDTDHTSNDWDSAATQVWVNMTLAAGRIATLRAAMSSSSVPAAGSNLYVTRGESAAFPTSGYLLIEDEVVRYSARGFDATRDLDFFTVQTRGARSTTAAAHAAAVTIYWVEHRVQLVYGYSGASAPANYDDQIPMILEGHSGTAVSNTSHVWANFYNILYPKAMQWAGLLIPWDNQSGRMFFRMDTTGGSQNVDPTTGDMAALNFQYYADPANVPNERRRGNTWLRSLPFPATGVAVTYQMDPGAIMQVLGTNSKGETRTLVTCINGTSDSLSSVTDIVQVAVRARNGCMTKAPTESNAASAFAAGSEPTVTTLYQPFTAQDSLTGASSVLAVTALLKTDNAAGSVNVNAAIFYEDPDVAGSYVAVSPSAAVTVSGTTATTYVIEFANPVMLVPGQRYFVRFTADTVVGPATIAKLTKYDLLYEGINGAYMCAVLSADMDCEPTSLLGEGLGCNVGAVTVTLASATVPYVSVKAEAAVYYIAGTLTNETTGQSIAVRAWIGLDEALEIDVAARTVRNTTLGESVLWAATFSDEDAWLTLQPGDNRLTWEESGQVAVDLDVSWSHRWA